jgi:hypothetical protein
VRLIRMLGLAMVAVIASMAFIAASSASAAHVLGFCLKFENLCAKANVIDPPAGGSVLYLASSTNATLENNAFFKTAEKCASSNTAVKVTEKDLLPLKGEVTELTFTSCTGPCKKVESKGLPWKKGSLNMTELEGDWVLTSEEGGALLSECTFGTKCEYGVPVANPVDLLGKNVAAGAEFKAEKEELEYKSGSGSGICGSTGTWTATYNATSAHLKNSTNEDIGLHSPWWLTLLEGP